METNPVLTEKRCAITSLRWKQLFTGSQLPNLIPFGLENLTVERNFS
jgi:hypothetical protein